MKVSILDLKGLVMNAYHSGEDPDAIREGEIKDSINTAGYGFSVFLSKFYDPILKICDSPLNMMAALDDGNTYRKKLFPDYKLNRSKVKQDPLEKEQINLAESYAKQFLLSQGVTLVGSKGEEADDVIGYLCKNLEGFKTVHTSDRDLIQLVNDQTYVFINGRIAEEMREKVICKGVKRDLMIKPSLVVLYKSLVGDSSDGYKGVNGIGAAAWAGMVDEFGIDGMEQLDSLMKADNKTKILATVPLTESKPFKKAAENFDTWHLMYKVAELAPDIVNPRWIRRVPELDRLKNVMAKAGCEYLSEKYEEHCYTATLVTRGNLEESLAKISLLITDTPFVPWDYETTDKLKIPEFIEAASPRQYVDMVNSRITGCSFAFGVNVNHVFYFSVDHKDTDNLDKSVVLDMIKLIESKNLDMVAQNSMFEMTVTKCQLNHSLKSCKDTKLYAHHLDENKECGLKVISKRYLNYTQTSYADTLKDAGAANMSEISGEDVLSYGADDSVVTGHLYQHFLHLSSLEGTREFIDTYECGAIRALSDAHIAGVRTDVAAINRMKKADLEVTDSSMASVRGALSQNAKAPNFEAVTVLFEDQADYYKMKAQGLKNATKESVAESQKVRKLKMKEHSFYTDLVEVPDYKPWIPTVVRFNEVCGYLELPLFKKVSRPGLKDWMFSLTKDQTESPLAKLVPAASNDFGERSSEAYLALQKYCNSVLEQFGGKKTLGTELNMNSPNQNQYLFYILLGLPIRRRTKVDRGSLRDKYSLAGSPATDADAIEVALANDCEGFPWKKEALQQILLYKNSSTRIKNYWNVYPLWSEGNRKVKGVEMVHPGINSCGTVTRRPTGSNPNLMQIAKGGVRAMFVASDKDSVICSIDFASQELRLNADECKDPTWMSAYTGDTPKDLHSLTGRRVVGAVLAKAKYTGSYPKEADGLMSYDFLMENKELPTTIGKLCYQARSIGKTVNFSSQFGAQAMTLSKNLMCPEEEAQQYLDAYNKTFPLLEAWKRKVIQEARAKGYVETAYGNRRHLEGINSSDRGLRGRWERQAINSKIQGCLQGSSLVQTREGLRGIESLVGVPVEVWTGFKWADAVGVNRGESQLARVTLEDGHVINCDVRHKLKGVYNQWLEFKDILEGTLVALPVKEEKFTGIEELVVDWEFVLGFFCGDGGINVRKNRPKNDSLRYTWSICGGRTKKGTILLIKKFLESQGINTFYRECEKESQDPLSILSIYKKEVVLDLINNRGFKTDNFDRKRVPEEVMRGTKYQVRSFLEGYLLSDGCRKPLSKRVHTPNLTLLRDVQRLYDFLGWESNIEKTGTGYYLDLCAVEGKTFPLGKLLRDLDGFVPSCEAKNNTSIVDRRVCQGGVPSPKDKTIRRIYKKHLPDKQIYSYSPVKSIQVLDKSETTYTMSVDDELHQFVADGVIHKNTAADMLKVVLTKIGHSQVLQKYGASLICPVYDEVLLNIPKKNLYEVITQVSQFMSLTVPGGTIPMVPDTSFGPTWGQQHEVGSFPSQETIDEVLEKL